MQTNRLNQLQEFLSNSPDDPFIIYALSLEYIKLEQLDNAKEHFEQLVNNHPDYVATYYHYGQLLEEIGELEEALKIYEKGMSIAEKQKDEHSLKELKQVHSNLEFEI